MRELYPGAYSGWVYDPNSDTVDFYADLRRQYPGTMPEYEFPAADIRRDCLGSIRHIRRKAWGQNRIRMFEAIAITLHSLHKHPGGQKLAG